MVVVLWTISRMVSVSRLITAPSSCTNSSEMPSRWKKRKPKVNWEGEESSDWLRSLTRFR